MDTTFNNLNTSISFAFSILSIVFYSIVYYPQFYIIYKTKKTDGISIWMVLIWSQADIFSLLGTIILNLGLSLIIIGWYHLLIGLTMTLCILYYDNTHKKFKTIAVSLYYVINLTTCIYFTTTMLYDEQLGTIFGWTSSVLYIIGRLPQIYLNYTRKTTEGLSSLMYIFTILGNISYLLTILIYSTETHYIYLNTPWIIMIIISVIADIIVILQCNYYKIPKNNTENNINNINL